jgi:hypothetical protein
MSLPFTVPTARHRLAELHVPVRHRQSPIGSASLSWREQASAKGEDTGSDNAVLNEQLSSMSNKAD